MLPSHVAFVMLSAIVPNALQFVAWVGRTKDRYVAIATMLERPVPLQHALLHCHLPDSDLLMSTIILREGG